MGRQKNCGFGSPESPARVFCRDPVGKQRDERLCLQTAVFQNGVSRDGANQSGPEEAPTPLWAGDTLHPQHHTHTHTLSLFLTHTHAAGILFLMIHCGFCVTTYLFIIASKLTRPSWPPIPPVNRWASLLMVLQSWAHGSTVEGFYWERSNNLTHSTHVKLDTVQERIKDLCCHSKHSHAWAKYSTSQFIHLKNKNKKNPSGWNKLC